MDLEEAMQARDGGSSHLLFDLEHFLLNLFYAEMRCHDPPKVRKTQFSIGEVEISTGVDTIPLLGES